MSSYPAKSRKKKGPIAADMVETLKKSWKALFLSVFWLLVPAFGWSAPDGESLPVQSQASVSDAALFAQELHAAGALKFYENTEDLVRAGRFEPALLRYAFLKGQIGRHPGYQPLLSVIEQRLDFLKAQMKIPERDLLPLSPPKVRKKPRQKTPTTGEVSHHSSPPEKSATEGKGKETEPGQDRQTAIPSSPAPVGHLEPEPSPGGPDRSPKTEDAENKGEKSVEASPKPSPGRWQRLKERLRFWQRKEKDL